jgi:hypothetical protein
MGVVEAAKPPNRIGNLVDAGTPTAIRDSVRN